MGPFLPLSFSPQFLRSSVSSPEQNDVPHPHPTPKHPRYPRVDAGRLDTTGTLFPLRYLNPSSVTPPESSLYHKRPIPTVTTHVGPFLYGLRSRGPVRPRSSGPLLLVGCLLGLFPVGLSRHSHPPRPRPSPSYTDRRLPRPVHFRLCPGQATVPPLF